MPIAKQLYQLQEVDLELESNEQTLKQIVSQLGESQTVLDARAKLASDKKTRQELAQQQHSLEQEVEDLASKLKKVEEELYGGRVRIPKELTNLHREAEELKTKRSQLEDKALQLMDQIDVVTRSIATLKKELKTLEAEWQSQQQQLSAQMEQVKARLAELGQKRQLLSSALNSQVIGLYSEIKQHKGRAVARVEQGACCGCRITLPVSELQRARTDNLVKCGCCGRILFVP